MSNFRGKNRNARKQPKQNFGFIKLRTSDQVITHAIKPHNVFIISIRTTPLALHYFVTYNTYTLKVCSAK